MCFFICTWIFYIEYQQLQLFLDWIFYCGQWCYKVFNSLLKSTSDTPQSTSVSTLSFSLKKVFSEGCSQDLDHISASEKAEHQVTWPKLSRDGHFMMGRSLMTYFFLLFKRLSNSFKQFQRGQATQNFLWKPNW